MFNNLGNIFKHVSFVKEGNATYPIEPEPSALYFSQSELQQIKEVLRVCIADEERMMCIYKAKARECKLGDCNEEANMFYKDAAKASKKIKSLAAIQAKLKHSIITLG